MKRTRFYFLALLPPLGLACGNGDNNNQPAPDSGSGADTSVADGASTDAESGAADAASDAALLTDGQIVGVVLTANNGEIEEAMLAVGNGDAGAADASEAGDASVTDAGDAAIADAGDGAVADAGDGSVADAGDGAVFDAGAARTSSPAVKAFAEMMIADHGMSNTAVEALGILAQTSPLETMLQTATQTTLSQLSPLSGTAFNLAYVQSQVTAHTMVRDLIQNQLIPSAQNAQLKAYLQNTLLPTVETHLTLATALLAQLTDAGVAADASSDAAL